jgi:eukaryotic-like serine/threonine-protein kinase
VNFGRYFIIKEVGHGSMGVVYQARDPQIDRVVAIKVLRQDRTVNETFVKRFLKEAKVIGRLSHPGIVTIYDVGEEQGKVYIAMEFLEGCSLADILRDRRLKLDEVVEFGIQIAKALDYIHQRGIVHRDIKPSNIDVQPDGQIRITDFGIAHIDDSSTTLQTQIGDIMGTPAYMSPEQVLGKLVDGRSDIFSLGVTLYEMCTGKRPFGGDGGTLAKVFNDIIQSTPSEPCVAEALIPTELSGVIMMALQKEPNNRFQTGNELAEALKMSPIRKENDVAAKPAPLSVQNNKWSFGMLLWGSMIAILAIGVIYYAYRSNQNIQPKQTVSTEKAPSAEKPVVPPVPPPDARSTASIPSAVVPSEPEKPLVSAPSTEVRPGAFVPSVPSSEPEKPIVSVPPSDARPGAFVPPVVVPNSEPEKPSRKHTVAEPKTLPSSVYTQQPHAKQNVVKEKEVQPPAPDKSRPVQILTSLTVKSNPQGASVYIDGNLKGATPITLMLPVGTHKIMTSLQGYQEATRKIDVEETMEFPLVFNLKPVK